MPLLPLLLIGGVAALYFLRMGTMQTNLNFIFRNIKVKGGSIIQPNVIITIGVQNPTNAEAVIKSITGKLSYEGKVFANFSSFEQTTVKRNSETLINITAIPNFTGVVSVLKNIIINKQKGEPITLTGTANVNNIILPINSSFQF